MATASRSFNKTITIKLVATCLLVMILAGLGFVLYFLEAETNKQFSTRYLPAIEKAESDKKAVFAALKALEAITNEKNSTQLPALNEALTQQLSQLKYSPFKNALLPKSAFYKTGNIDVNLNRLAKNGELNLQIKQDSEKQMLTLIDHLQKETLDKEVKLEQLFSQIESDRSNDRVTANRARAHAKLMHSLRSFYQLDQLTSDLLLQLQSLSFHTAQSDFEQTTTLFDQMFTIFEQLKSDDQINSQTLQTQFLVLEKLLYSEQNGLSKWRGHIRIAEPYLTAVSLQKNQLLDAFSQHQSERQKAMHTESMMVNLINQQFALSISKNELLLGIYGAISFFALLLLLTLLSIRGKTRRFSAENLSITKTLLADASHQIENLTYNEQVELAELISNVQKPAHSEADYQLLKDEYGIQANTLLANSQAAFFDFSWQASDERWQPALTLCSHSTEPLNLFGLRKLMTSTAFQELISTLKTVKAEGEQQNLRVTLANEDSLLVAIDYTDNHFIGSLNNCNETIVSENTIDALEQQLAESEVSQREHNLSQAQQIQKVTTRLSLQNQDVLLSQGVSSLKVHHRLTKLFSMCEQEIELMRLQDENHTLVLSDCNLNNLLQAVLFNSSLDAARKKHAVYLNIDDAVHTNINTDASYLQKLTSALMATCLAEQQAITLTLDCQLVDQNPGQQVVRFAFSSSLNQQGSAQNQNNTACQLPKLITLLLPDKETIASAELQDDVRYIADILSVLHGKNIQASNQETGYQFSFELPLATDKNTSTIANETPDFAKANILVLANNGLAQQRLLSALRERNGTPEHIGKLEYLQQQLSIKHLEKNAVDLLIVAPEFNTHLTTINEHLATLPTRFQPKIFVMQSCVAPALQRNGLFSPQYPNLSLMSTLNSIADVLAGEEKSNQLLGAALFKTARPLQSPVEVLVATANVADNFLLLQLLQWFGVQITLVSTQQTLNEAWQTGRYLVLFTSLAQPVSTKLDAGNLAKRCIISLGADATFTNDMVNKAKHWQFENLSEDLSAEQLVEKLTAILTPWLISKVSAPAAKPAIPKLSTDNHAFDNAHAASHDASHKEKFGVEHALFELLPTSQELEISANEPINLAQFAHNQGAPALAAYMLDDYLAELKHYCVQLKQALSEQQIEESLVLLTNIRNLAKLIAAPDISAANEQLIEEIQANELQAAQQTLISLISAVASATEYAEAI